MRVSMIGTICPDSGYLTARIFDLLFSTRACGGGGGGRGSGVGKGVGRGFEVGAGIECQHVVVCPEEGKVAVTVMSTGEEEVMTIVFEWWAPILNSWSGFG